MRLRTFLALLLVLVSVPAQATDRDERRAVLAAVQGLFDALAARDRAAIMALVIPDGRITSHVRRDGALVVRTGSWDEWADRIVAGSDRLEERMHAPRVRTSGSLATVWTDYSFHRNGAFSHCGVDLVDLAKVGGRWRILNISFTVETEGCRRR